MPKHRRRPRRFRAQPPDAAGPEPAAPPPAPADSFTTFRARMNAGDLDGIIGARLRRALRDAAADTSPDFEIGALRLLLARLLKEEPDPSRQAAAACRIAAAAVQAARFRQPADSLQDTIQTHLLRELAAIEAERAEARGRQAQTKEPAGTHPLPDTIDW